MVAIVESPIQEGLPYPQGASWDGEGVNFARANVARYTANPGAFQLFRER